MTTDLKTDELDAALEQLKAAYPHEELNVEDKLEATKMSDGSIRRWRTFQVARHYTCLGCNDRKCEIYFGRTLAEAVDAALNKLTTRPIY